MLIPLIHFPILSWCVPVRVQDLSLSLLGVEYVDLFGFHGINTEQKLEWTMRDGGCMEVAKEYQRAGKLRWIGFSTHAMTPLIIKAIETDAFDYVNL